MSSQFSTLQLCNITVLAARFWGHFLTAKSYFQCTIKWTRRTRRALRSIISNFKYRYHPEKTKKNFKCSSIIITCQPRVLHGFISAAAIQPRQNRVGELQPALAVISIQKRTKKNNCDRNWRENSQRRLRVHANAHAENHQSQHKKKYKTPLIERNIAQPCTKFEIWSTCFRVQLGVPDNLFFQKKKEE